MTSSTYSRLLPNALVAACVLGLAACTPAGKEATSPAAQTQEQPQVEPVSATSPTTDTPTSTNVDPATPPADSTPDPTLGLSTWNGYGDTTFGMDEAAFRKAWGGDLSNYEGEEKASCFHLWPKGQKTSAELAFMFGDTKFARYSTENPKLTAPGGGKIGMSRSEIDKLYAGRIDEQPHKYTDGKYLRITEGKNVLIFEADKAGKVTEWRVGVPPYVDYVEGCA